MPRSDIKLTPVNFSPITQLKMFSPSHDAQCLALTIQGIMLNVIFFKSLRVFIVAFQLDLRLPWGKKNIVYLFYLFSSAWITVGDKTLPVDFSHSIRTGKEQRCMKGHDFDGVLFKSPLLLVEIKIFETNVYFFILF